jgi:UDPglucose 6-dehydrogenase
VSVESGYDRPCIAVLGLGHIGLPTAVGFAELGWSVFCADEDASRVAKLRSGKSGFSEPELDDLLARLLTSGRLKLCDSIDEAIRAATILFICVGTPQKETGEADLSQVEAVT